MSSLVTNLNSSTAQKIILGHDCRRVRSHRRHDAARLRCWRICSDSSRLSPTSCEFRTHCWRDSTRQLSGVGVRRRCALGVILRWPVDGVNWSCLRRVKTATAALPLLVLPRLSVLPARRRTDRLAIPSLRAKLSALPVRPQGPIPTGTEAGDKTQPTSARKRCIAEWPTGDAELRALGRDHNYNKTCNKAYNKT